MICDGHWQQYNYCMSSQNQRDTKLTSFYKSGEAIESTDYIFDNTYKSATEKRKFEKNRKFAYFNALTKIKNNKAETKRNIYHQMLVDNSVAIQPGRFQKNADWTPRKAFHVEKINNHLFKIYKNSNHSQSRGEANSNTLIEDTNFEIFFKRAPRAGQNNDGKRQMKHILKEYQNLKTVGSLNPADSITMRHSQEGHSSKSKPLNLSLTNSKIQIKSNPMYKH